MASKKQKSSVSLSILDRIIIPAILNGKGSYEQRIIMRDLKNKISLTQNEIKKFEIKTIEDGESSRIVWNEKGRAHFIETEFTELEKLEIKLSLEKLNKEKKITDELINLYEIFVLNK